MGIEDHILLQILKPGPRNQRIEFVLEVRPTFDTSICRANTYFRKLATFGNGACPEISPMHRN